MPWRLLLALPALAAGVVTLVDLGFGLVGLPGVRRVAGAGSHSTRFLVLVPAHDEAAVLGPLLRSLAAQAYPRELVEVVVLADHCTDDTAAVAQAAGVAVVERRVGTSGKTAALRWAVAKRRVLADAVVVFDADNLCDPHLLAAFDSRLAAGEEAIQARLDVKNPTDTATTAAYAVAYWADNRQYRLARERLGLATLLGGTGMCMTAPLFGRALTGAGRLVDDLGMTLALAEHGVRVHWAHEAAVYDEKPLNAAAAARQRGRWAAGQRGRRAAVQRVTRVRAWSVVRRADLAAQVLAPGRLPRVALGVAGLVSAGALAVVGTGTAWVLACCAPFAAQVALPLVFALVEGRRPRVLTHLPALAGHLLVSVRARLFGARRHGAAWDPTRHTRAVDRPS